MAYSSLYFTDYPLTVNSVSIASSDPEGFDGLAHTSAAVSNVVLTSAAAAAPIALAVSSPGSAFVIQQLVAEMLYLRLVDGATPYYAEVLFGSLLEV